MGGSKSAKRGPNPLADMDRGGPNPLADLDRGVQIRCDTARTGRFFFFIQPIKSLISGVVVAVAVVVT